MPTTVTLLLVALLLALPSNQNAEDQVLRVRLFSGERLESVRLSADVGDLDVYDAESNERIARTPAGSGLTLEGRDEVVRLRWDGGGALIRHVRVETVEPLLHVRTGRLERSYRGAITVSTGPSGGLLVVNEVDLEAYVASVLPSEYPFQEPEGARAQAVAIRTYALAAARKFGDLYDLSDDVTSQVYRGAAAETPVSRAAARDTRGEVLLHDGSLIEAVYSASNGGHTADNTSVWQGRPSSYLNAKPDPFDRDERYDRWTTRLDASRLHDALARRLDARVTGVRIAAVSSEGRALTLETEGAPEREFRAGEFRSLVNAAFGENTVRSTFFEMRRQGGIYELSGRGFGHGVGLSQIGTRNRARAGQSYREILAFYFERTELARLDATSPEPAWLAEETRPADRESLPEADDQSPDVSNSPHTAERRASVREPKVRHNRVSSRRVGW